MASSNGSTSLSHRAYHVPSPERAEQFSYTPLRIMPAVVTDGIGSAEPSDLLGSSTGATQSTTERTLEVMQHRAQVAAAKLHVRLSQAEDLDIQRDSVYGSAMVMPQFARSSGWIGDLSTLAVRSYFFLFMNVLLQWLLVYNLNKEQHVMDAFGGQMNLCDFGAGQSCPDGDGCTGPLGTQITPSRLYSYSQWSTRIFVKDSLASLFPGREQDISDMVDPGEYGVESHSVRVLCTFIFVMTGLTDFYEVMSMAELLLAVPTRAASWMDYDGDTIIMKIAGMPAGWKVVTMIVVILPKFCLWVFTLRTGITFLMDTADIVDTIVNTTALGFILSIDELIFATITTSQTRFMMGALEGYSKKDSVHQDPGEGDDGDDEQLIEQSGVKQWKLRRAFPRRLILCLVLWGVGVYEYYWRKCVRGSDGAFVSIDMFLPKSTDYSYLSAFFPYMFPVPHEDKPFWSMPKV